MNDSQNLILVVAVVVLCLAAVIAGVRRSRKKQPQSSRWAALRQDLRRKVLYDEAKIDRLIELERDELTRKGRREETVEDLRSIEETNRFRPSMHAGMCTNAKGSQVPYSAAIYTRPFIRCSSPFRSLLCIRYQAFRTDQHV